MPILFVDNAYGFGGSIVALARLLRHLSPREFAAHVVVRHPDQAAWLRGEHLPLATLHEIPMSPPVARTGRGLVTRLRGAIRHVRRQAPYALAVRRVARAVGARLLHGNNCVAANQGVIVAARALRIPCVVKQHGYEWPSADVRLLAKLVDHYLPDSEDVARDLARIGVPRERMTVTWCPIELPPRPTAAVAASLRAEARRELGLPLDAPVVGIVGVLQEWKGQHVFLEALAKARRDLPTLRGVIVGGDALDADPGCGARLRDLARTLGIADAVVFTGHRADVARVLPAFDVATHASIRPEPFGMVVSEAMAAGIPVVASDAGGPAEQVVEGRTGHLVPPGDAEAIAARWRELLADPERRRRFGAAARRRVAERFSAEEHARRTAEVYRRVLAARGVSD